MKRTFIAVRVIPEEALMKAIADLKAFFPPRSVKWVDPGIMHITLAFLGDTDDNLVVQIARELELSCTGAGRAGFVVSGFGVFPSARRPKVIWAGIKNGESLIHLHSRVEEVLAKLNIPVEEREFTPHLTLGRVRFPDSTGNPGKILEKYKDVDFQNIEINELIYYESILKPEGPVYKPFKIILL